LNYRKVAKVIKIPERIKTTKTAKIQSASLTIPFTILSITWCLCAKPPGNAHMAARIAARPATGRAEAGARSGQPPARPPAAGTRTPCCSDPSGRRRGSRAAHAGDMGSHPVGCEGGVTRGCQRQREPRRSDRVS